MAGLIVLDTNVLSELLRVRPDPAVVQWVATQPPERLRVTTVTQAEMLYGAHLLHNHRRQLLLATVGDLFVGFSSRSLAFDAAAAEVYARIAARRRSRGRPISQFDGQIAAIALVADAQLATRNTADFEDCGLTIINPWPQ